MVKKTVKAGLQYISFFIHQLVVAKKRKHAYI